MRKRGRGPSAEMSDAGRAGSPDARRGTSRNEEAYPPTKCRGADRREGGGRRAIAERDRGRGSRPRSECDQRCHARPDSSPQPDGTRENRASCAGLRPEANLKIAERSHGRANRQFLAGEHGCDEAGRHDDRHASTSTGAQARARSQTQTSANDADRRGGVRCSAGPRRRSCSRRGWSGCRPRAWCACRARAPSRG